MSPNRTIRLTPRQAVWAIIALTLVTSAVVVIVSVVVSATKTAKIQDVQKSNTKTLDYSKETLLLLKDCVQPSGECYKRGQETTKGAVANITQYAVYAAVCVDEPGKQSLEETTACIVRLVKAEEAARQRS